MTKYTDPFGASYDEPKRFDDALFIQAGAVNPSGIARSLVRACSECIAEGASQREDPAVRLIVHQLAYLCGSDSLDRGLSNYHDAMEACRTKAKPQTLGAIG